MRKTVTWLLLLALLCACTPKAVQTAAPPEPTIYLTAEQVAAALLDSQSDRADYAPLDGEDLQFYVNQLYGVEEGAYSEAAVYTAGGVDPREFAVVCLPEDGGTAKAGTGMETYRQSRVGDFFGYEPQAAALVERGRTVTADHYAVLLICSDPDAAAKALASLLRISGAPEPVTTQAVSAPVSTPSTLPTATAEPTPEPTATPVPASEPAPVVASEPTPVLSPEPALDVSGFVPFDPPLAVDMSLYDDTPIVAAWNSGDESGLDEKQAAILAKCREIFDEVITEDMTDFQKEWFLYRWLIFHGEYDRTHYDPRTPLGRPDNTNPYGMLVKGYGICLGYAETFRLFMDLAGVECFTVCGAAYHNDEDHAWNMVKLEGEWYCVDPTWDGGGTGRNYNYFNVTSDRLRETDHQWDYANVPEATATRFYWDGRGKQPS